MELYPSPKASSSTPSNSSGPRELSHSGGDGSSLKLSIALSGQKPTIIQKGPFYLLKAEAIPLNEITGATNLMASKGLEHSYNKLTTKKMKDSLSSFLPHLPGNLDAPGSQDNSSLRGLIEKPPVCGKELLPLTQLQLSGFRLHPGPLPEHYRSLTSNTIKKKHKKHKHKHRGGETPLGAEGTSLEVTGEEREKKKEKKHKKHDKDAEERKKRKKEKKKKKNKEDKEIV